MVNKLHVRDIKQQESFIFNCQENFLQVVSTVIKGGIAFSMRKQLSRKLPVNEQLSRKLPVDEQLSDSFL